MFFFTCNTDPWLKLSNKSCSYMTVIPHILKKSLDQTRISVSRTLPVFMNKSLSVATCLANRMKPSQTILCWVLNVELLYLLFFFSVSRNRQVKMPQPRGWEWLEWWYLKEEIQFMFRVKDICQHGGYALWPTDLQVKTYTHRTLH